MTIVIGSAPEPPSQPRDPEDGAGICIIVRGVPESRLRGVCRHWTSSKGQQRAPLNTVPAGE